MSNETEDRLQATLDGVALRVAQVGKMNLAAIAMIERDHAAALDAAYARIKVLTALVEEAYGEGWSGGMSDGISSCHYSPEVGFEQAWKDSDTFTALEASK